MEIKITNKRILSFFEQRPEMDVETTILKFIDIMESLQENMNKKLTNTTFIEILDNIKSMRMDNERNMVDIKKDLNQDIKMIMSVGMNENLEPKLKEQQTQLVNNVSEKLEKLVENKIGGLRETTLANKEIVSTQNNTLNDFLKRFENSSKKGKISENILFNVLSETYPLAEINSVGTTKETGDLIFMRKNKPKILIENKEWSRPVINSEVVKFIRDVEIQKCNGIFLAQKSGITSKDNFEVNLINNSQVLVYVHNVNFDPEKIKVAVDIADSISEILKNIEILEINVDKEYSISKELTQYINTEYQNYLTHREDTIKLAKDFLSNLIKHEEEFRFSSLEKFLVTNCQTPNSKNVCKYCGFVAKKASSLSVHVRSCKKKKEKLAGNENVELCVETDK
jgi:hypothetical protein